MNIGDIIYFTYLNINKKNNKDNHLILFTDMDTNYIYGIDLHMLFLHDFEFTLYYYTQMKKFYNKSIQVNPQSLFDDIIKKYPAFSLEEKDKIAKENLKGKFKEYMTMLKNSYRKFKLTNIISKILQIDEQKVLRKYK